MAQDATALMIRDREFEIEVETNWSNVLDVSPVASLAADQVAGREVWLVDDLFSAAECEELIARSEQHGFGGTNYAKSYRGNLRLITKDPGLTDAVWQRLKPLVPPSLEDENGEGVWDAVGLNECWRLAKYYPGDVFGQHCDACFTRQFDIEESKLTVNIYMNGGFEGGATRFYFNGRSGPAYSVVPNAGRCLVFRQPPGKAYLHDGEKLGSGVKYLFRSDVMYRKRTSMAT